jgi:Domain of unknown function (DUF4915)
MQLLVSLCNLSQPGASGLVRVTPGRPARTVMIGAPDEGVAGCVGLWAEPNHVYCAWAGTDGRSYLSALEQPTFDVLDVVPLGGVKDVHSITVLDGFLYLVSTGTDEVRRVPLDRPGARSEVVWRASGATCDTHHVNAIVNAGGRILCSAFGPKAGTRWSTALDGYVVDIQSGEVLCRGIEHPHSLMATSDDVYVAESRRARVRGLAHDRTMNVDGYARGLCRSGKGFVVGVSTGRSRSRSLGTIENAADPGDRAGEAGLSFFGDLLPHSPGRVPDDTMDLSQHGPEIYDVLPLTGEWIH